MTPITVHARVKKTTSQIDNRASGWMMDRVTGNQKVKGIGLFARQGNWQSDSRVAPSERYCRARWGNDSFQGRFCRDGASVNILERLLNGQTQQTTSATVSQISEH